MCVCVCVCVCVRLAGAGVIMMLLFGGTICGTRYLSVGMSGKRECEFVIVGQCGSSMKTVFGPLGTPPLFLPPTNHPLTSPCL